MLQKQKFLKNIFGADFFRFCHMRGYANHTFSAWKNGHVDFPHTFARAAGLFSGSVPAPQKEPAPEKESFQEARFLQGTVNPPPHHVSTSLIFCTSPFLMLIEKYIYQSKMSPFCKKKKKQEKDKLNCSVGQSTEAL